MFPRDIPQETCFQHFRQVLQSKDTRPSKDIMDIGGGTSIDPFTIQEVQNTVSTLKDRKACGPDNIFNEYLKSAAPMLINTWTDFYKECLSQKRIPEWWRTRNKTLYNGKGDITDPHSHRSIELEFSLLKTPTKLLTERLITLVDKHIPIEQFGFRKNHLTIHAVKYLQNDIQEALRHPRRKLLAVFVDYAKAFDTIE